MINDNCSPDLELEIKQNKFLLLDFWAEWCSPCKTFSPIFQDYAKNNKEVKCLKINIDENQDTAVKYEVRSIPTIILIKDGKIIDRKIGMLSKDALHKWVSAFTE